MSEESEREEAGRKVRAENRRTANRIEQGIEYHETVTVWFTDRQEHQVEVYAMSSRQFREAAKKGGLTNFTDLVSENGEIKRDRFMQSLDFMAAIAESATHDPTITARLLTPNDDAKIASKAFDLMKEPKN